MLKRVVSSLVGLAILFVVLLADNVMVMRGAVVIASLMALYELYHAFGYIKETMLVVLGVLSTLFIVFGQIYDIKFIIPLIFVYVLLLSVAMLKYHKSIHFSDMANMVFFAIYIPFFLTTILFVRNMEYGKYLIWMVFGGAWLTDTCAFFAGKLCGRHKLCPNISPKKTVEGAVGGVLGTAILFLAYGYALQQLAGITVHYLPLGILAVCAGIVSEIGDLTASMIKRELKLKDFGNVMPGHGGILDRFDSLLFVAPLIYGFLLNFRVFG